MLQRVSDYHARKDLLEAPPPMSEGDPEIIRSIRERSFKFCAGESGSSL